MFHESNVRACTDLAVRQLKTRIDQFKNNPQLLHLSQHSWSKFTYLDAYLSSYRPTSTFLWLAKIFYCGIWVCDDFLREVHSTSKVHSVIFLEIHVLKAENIHCLPRNLLKTGHACFNPRSFYLLKYVVRSASNGLSNHATYESTQNLLFPKFFVISYVG